MHKKRVRNNFYSWHPNMTTIFKRSSFRNARNTIKYSFAFLQSERLNLVAILGASCKSYFILVSNLFIILLVIALSGCSLSPVQIAPESSYTITKWPQENSDFAQKKPVTNKTILVTTPIASPGYETANMIYVTVPYQLKSFTSHRWVASPAQLLLPLLADRIRARNYFKGVLTSPFSGGTSYQLNTQLLSLQQEFLQPQSQIRLKMQATLLNASTGEMIASRVFQAVVSTQRNDPYGGVLATNEAATRILGQIARWTTSSSR